MNKRFATFSLLMLVAFSLAGCTSEDLAEINDVITDESKDCYVVMSSTNAMIKYPAEYAHMADDGYNQTMTYDEQCRLSSTFKVTNWFESYQNMTYSDDGHLVKVESYSSSDNWSNSSYNYDVYVYENGLLVQHQEHNPESNITSYENYTYDGEGREISSEHSGIYTNTTYGSDGSVTQTVLTSPYGTTIENMSYDDNGNLVQTEIASKWGDGDWSNYFKNYTYENGLLIQETDGWHTMNYTYDGNGNLIERETSSSSSSDLTVMAYDENGNMLSETSHSGQNEDGGWNYVEETVFTWGDPLAEA